MEEKIIKKPVSELENYSYQNIEEIDSILEKELAQFDRKVIVLDDDPTGVQTVHDVSVYTDWSVDSIVQGMNEDNSMFFILTNSRSFSVEKTTQVHKEIAENAIIASKKTGKKFIIISRGDSTLRGHYPLETEILRNVLEKNEKTVFNGEILCPYFKEGGRFTIDGIHYVKEGEWLIPAAQTEFAKDKSFGYAHSDLAEYIEEKSKGRVSSRDVIKVTLKELRNGNPDEIAGKLSKAEGFHYIAVDAIDETDVKVFTAALLKLMKEGKEYLIRCAAAVPKVIGNVKNRPLLTKSELTDKDCTYGGIVLAGSHVQKTTRQLESLRQSKINAQFIEFDVNTCHIENGLEMEADRVVSEAEAVMETGRTAVVFTSRTLYVPEGATKDEILAASVRISDAVTSVIAKLHKRPRFIIAKGGITSSDVGTKALRVKKACVLGQVQPGIPVWKTGPESLFPGIPYIIFPGNVGNDDTLRLIAEELA